MPSLLQYKSATQGTMLYKTADGDQKNYLIKFHVLK